MASDTDVVTLTWNKVTRHTFQSVEIPYPALEAIVRKHVADFNTTTAQEIDWLDADSAELQLILADVAAYAGAEGDLDSEEIEDLEHDTEDYESEEDEEDEEDDESDESDDD